MDASPTVNDGRCTRCGERHTSRQRCPSDLSHPTNVPSPIWLQPDFHGLLMLPAPSLPTRTASIRPRHHTTLRATGAWLAAIFGTIVLITAASVAGTFIAQLTQAGDDVRQALIVIFSSTAAGILFGALPLYLFVRPYAKVVLSILSIFLITAGVVMLVVAPVLRQMNTPELAEYRAFAALTWFGALALLAGLFLGAMCLRWATRPRAVQQLSRWSRLLGSAYGVLIGISGVFGIVSLLFLINSRSEDAGVPERAIATSAVAMFSLVPGLILTYHGISASMGEQSTPWRPPMAAIVLFVYAAVLLVGGLDMAALQPVAAPMPLLHVLAAALPGITLVGLAARGSVLSGRPVLGLTWRQVTLAAAISMTVATTIAVYVESLGSFGAVVLLLVHNGAFESARNSHDFWQAVGHSDIILTRNEQFFANLITASLVAPVIEELGKGLGARFMMRSTTTRSQAFVLGAAAGAGFGFLEAMLYGVGGVHQSGPGTWWAIMLVRGGSTSLHVLNTGLVGLAWWYASFGRAKRRGWLLFALAVALHALWNGFAIVLDSRIFGLDTVSHETLTMIAYGIVGVLSLCFISVIPLIARHVREPLGVPA